MAYLVGLVAGGIVAYWTFDPAIDTAVSPIRVVANLDVDAFVLTDFVIMVVFFVTSNVATHSLDRLVVGGTGFVLAGE